MKDEYILNPSNFIFKLSEHFPKLLPGNRVGIFLSGGMESTLISYISIQLYGRENIVFFYSDNIFTCNDPDTNIYVRNNIANAEKNLNIKTEYVTFDYSLHVSDRQFSISKTIEHIKETYDVEFLLFGFTKLFFDVETFKQPGTTIQDIKRITSSNPEKYNSIIEEFHLKTNRYTEHILNIDIPPEVYTILKSTSNYIKSPFKDINKSEVVDLYRQLDILDLLYQTTSCIEDTITNTGKHCGTCFNCQQRWDAFDILGTVSDKTEYVSDIIKHQREELKYL